MKILYESEPYEAWEKATAIEGGKMFYLTIPMDAETFLAHPDRIKRLVIDDAQRNGVSFCREHGESLVGQMYVRIWQDEAGGVRAQGRGVSWSI